MMTGFGRIAATLPYPHRARAPWRAPAITVARLTLESYLRSRWILAETLVLIFLLAAFFFPYYGDTAYFYTQAGEALGAVTMLGTGMLVRYSVTARAYLVLARLPTRGAYSMGVMMAAAVLRLPLFLLFLGLALAFGRILHPTLGALLVGAVGLLANCVALSALTAALSPPLATRWARIIALGWAAAALFPYADIAMLPAPFVGALSTLLSLARVPLLPFTVCFAFSTRGTIGLPDLVALLAEALYVVALGYLAALWLNRRDLLLH